MDEKTSITDVMIDGVKYIPVKLEIKDDKPPGEKDVNYRALVNDKLQELGTFYECSEREKEMGMTDHLCLGEFSNPEMFIKAGRIQEVLINFAFYGSDGNYSLYLELDSGDNWEQVYLLLLKHERFIRTGVRS